MTILQPLQLLLAQTDRERDAALAVHQRALSACRAADAQTEQLRTYRIEYEQRWQTRFTSDGPMELVRCYQGFMERLTQAVEAQTRAAQNVAAEAERSAGVLRERELRCASVRKLIERRVVDIKVDIDRRAQRSSDEIAARAAWNGYGPDRGAE